MLQGAIEQYNWNFTGDWTVATYSKVGQGADGGDPTTKGEPYPQEFIHGFEGDILTYTDSASC